MAYGGGMGYHLHMPSYFWRTFTEYPYRQKGKIVYLEAVSPMLYFLMLQQTNHLIYLDR